MWLCSNSFLYIIYAMLINIHITDIVSMFYKLVHREFSHRCEILIHNLKIKLMIYFIQTSRRIKIDFLFSAFHIWSKKENKSKDISKENSSKWHFKPFLWLFISTFIRYAFIIFHCQDNYLMVYLSFVFLQQGDIVLLKKSLIHYISLTYHSVLYWMPIKNSFSVHYLWVLLWSSHASWYYYFVLLNMLSNSRRVEKIRFLINFSGWHEWTASLFLDTPHFDRYWLQEF